QPIDCVLLDVTMPGLGGLETCRRIKASARLREVPLLMITATDDRQAMIEGLTAGADDYIVKSNEIELLKARVHAQIRRKQLDDEIHRRREDQLRSEVDAELARKSVCISDVAHAVAAELARSAPERHVSFAIQPGLVASADAGLLRVLLENLLGNAWKFTAKRVDARIEFGAIDDATGRAF